MQASKRQKLDTSPVDIPSDSEMADSDGGSAACRGAKWERGLQRGLKLGFPASFAADLAASIDPMDSHAGRR